MLGSDFSTESRQETGFSGEGDGRDELNFMSPPRRKKEIRERYLQGEQLSSRIIKPYA